MTGQNFLNFLCGKSGQIGLLRKNIGDTSYRAFMLECLNLVLKDIQIKQVNWHWRFLERIATTPTVANQMDYALPTISGGSAFDIDTHKIFAVYDRTQDITYKYIPYERFIRLVADPTNNKGSSCIWTLWANKLKLFPVPSSVWTAFMDCIALITALTDSATACVVPAKYDPVIIHGALKWAYMFDKALGSYADQEALYEKGLLAMTQDNSLVISDYGKSESHREKYNTEGDVDGDNSLLFPLAQP